MEGVEGGPVSLYESETSGYHNTQQQVGIPLGPEDGPTMTTEEVNEVFKKGLCSAASRRQEREKEIEALEAEMKTPEGLARAKRREEARKQNLCSPQSLCKILYPKPKNLKRHRK